MPRIGDLELYKIARIVFFDGTGSNKKGDLPDNKFSNPARIWRAAQELTELDTTNFAFYISGVGTEFSDDSSFSNMVNLQLMDGSPEHSN